LGQIRASWKFLLVLIFSAQLIVHSWFIEDWNFLNACATSINWSLLKHTALKFFHSCLILPWFWTRKIKIDLAVWWYAMVDLPNNIGTLSVTWMSSVTAICCTFIYVGLCVYAHMHRCLKALDILRYKEILSCGTHNFYLLTQNLKRMTKWFWDLAPMHKVVKLDVLTNWDLIFMCPWRR